MSESDDEISIQNHSSHSRDCSTFSRNRKQMFPKKTDADCEMLFRITDHHTADQHSTTKTNEKTDKESKARSQHGPSACYRTNHLPVQCTPKFHKILGLSSLVTARGTAVTNILAPMYSTFSNSSYNGLHNGCKRNHSDDKHVVDPKSAKKIQGLLKREDLPTTSTSAHNDRSQEVSSIVSKILASTSKAQCSKTSQKYVVMPVLHAPMLHGTQQPTLRYMLINARQAQPAYNVASGNVYPCFNIRAPNTTVPVILRQRQMVGPMTVTLRPGSLAIVCSASDSVRKWLDRNRDILSKTLISVAEKLNIATIVTIMLIKNREAYNEHVCMKWIGIALMLLTKNRIKEATGSNNRWAIPSVLNHMWNNLKSFFTVYEGCLQLVKENREKSPIALTNAAKDLQIEDQAFESMLGHVFLAYTKNTGEELPRPSNLADLDEFISGLNDTISPPARTKPNRGGHITSVITGGPRTSADITQLYKRHKIVCSASEPQEKDPKLA